jgi:hypothetical protein
MPSTPQDAAVIDWDRTWPLPLSGDAVTLEPGLSLRRAGSTDAALWRFEPPETPRLVRLGAGHLRLVPTLPAEPLVLRFDARLDLTPGPGHAAIFAGLPVNLRLEHVPGPGMEPATLAERVSPGLRRHLAVGQVEDPVLARAVDVGLYDSAAGVPEGLAVMPLRLRLPESGLRSLDRVMLPAGGLSLWAGGKVLYTAAVEVDLREADALEVRILAEVPRADVSLRFGPTSNTGEFSLKALMRSLTQLARGAD